MKNIQIKHQPPEVVDVVHLIKIICLKGNGNEDPIRKVERYYDLNGIFIFEKKYLIFINEFISFRNTNF